MPLFLTEILLIFKHPSLKCHTHISTIDHSFSFYKVLILTRLPPLYTVKIVHYHVYHAPFHEGFVTRKRLWAMRRELSGPPGAGRFDTPSPPLFRLT